MAQIERIVVASGIIGEYSHEWEVHRLYDKKYDSECYNLYINREYIEYFSSVVEALDALVENFRQ